ncbi:MAG: hypothetical protein M4579_006397 [Chaenotheca gracillima]|nr:MAG: hypothetical protein M4579_006397 [Chaenotheca gracillima]
MSSSRSDEDESRSDETTADEITADEPGASGYPPGPETIDQVEWGPFPEKAEYKQAFTAWNLPYAALLQGTMLFAHEIKGLDNGTQETLVEGILRDIRCKAKFGQAHSHGPADIIEDVVEIQNGVTGFNQWQEPQTRPKPNEDQDSDGWRYDQFRPTLVSEGTAPGGAESQVDSRQTPGLEAVVTFEGKDIFQSGNFKKGDLGRILGLDQKEVKKLKLLELQTMLHDREKNRTTGAGVQSSATPIQSIETTGLAEGEGLYKLPDLSKWGVKREDDYVIPYKPGPVYTAWDLYTWAIYLSPYNPVFWISRAYYYYQKGLWDLALGDAYRAHTLTQVFEDSKRQRKRRGLLVRVHDALDNHLINYCEALERRNQHKAASKINARFAEKGIDAGFLKALQKAVGFVITPCLFMCGAHDDYQFWENRLLDLMPIKKPERRYPRYGNPQDLGLRSQSPRRRGSRTPETKGSSEWSFDLEDDERTTHSARSSQMDGGPPPERHPSSWTHDDEHWPKCAINVTSEMLDSILSPEDYIDRCLAEQRQRSCIGIISSFLEHNPTLVPGYVRQSFPALEQKVIRTKKAFADHVTKDYLQNWQGDDIANPWLRLGANGSNIKVVANRDIPSGTLIYADEPNVRGHVQNVMAPSRVKRWKAGIKHQVGKDNLVEDSQLGMGKSGGFRCENCMRPISNETVKSKREAMMLTEWHSRDRKTNCRCVYMDPPLLFCDNETNKARNLKKRSLDRDDPPPKRPRVSQLATKADDAQPTFQATDRQRPDCHSIACALYHYRTCNIDWRWLHKAVDLSSPYDRSHESRSYSSKASIVSLLLRDVFDLTLIQRELHKEPHIRPHEIDALFPLSEGQMTRAGHALLPLSKGQMTRAGHAHEPAWTDPSEKTHGDQNHARFPFTWAANIVVPFDILECMGVNIFRDPSFDTWTIQAAMRKLTANAVPWCRLPGKDSAQTRWKEATEREKSVLADEDQTFNRQDKDNGHFQNLYIHTAFALFNHGCSDAANATWKWDRTTSAAASGPYPLDPILPGLLAPPPPPKAPLAGIPNRVLVTTSKPITKGTEIRINYWPRTLYPLNHEVHSPRQRRIRKRQHDELEEEAVVSESAKRKLEEALEESWNASLSEFRARQKLNTTHLAILGRDCDCRLCQKLLDGDQSLDQDGPSLASGPARLEAALEHVSKRRKTFVVATGNAPQPLGEIHPQRLDPEPQQIIVERERSHDTPSTGRNSETMGRIFRTLRTFEPQGTSRVPGRTVSRWLEAGTPPDNEQQHPSGAERAEEGREFSGRRRVYGNVTEGSSPQPIPHGMHNIIDLSSSSQRPARISQVTEREPTRYPSRLMGLREGELLEPSTVQRNSTRTPSPSSLRIPAMFRPRSAGVHAMNQPELGSELGPPNRDLPPPPVDMSAPQKATKQFVDALVMPPPSNWEYRTRAKSAASSKSSSSKSSGSLHRQVRQTSTRPQATGLGVEESDMNELLSSAQRAVANAERARMQPEPRRLLPSAMPDIIPMNPRRAPGRTRGGPDDWLREEQEAEQTPQLIRRQSRGGPDDWLREEQEALAAMEGLQTREAQQPTTEAELVEKSVQSATGEDQGIRNPSDTPVPFEPMPWEPARAVSSTTRWLHRQRPGQRQETPDLRQEDISPESSEAGNVPIKQEPRSSSDGPQLQRSQRSGTPDLRQEDISPESEDTGNVRIKSEPRSPPRTQHLPPVQSEASPDLRQEDIPSEKSDENTVHVKREPSDEQTRRQSPHREATPDLRQEEISPRSSEAGSIPLSQVPVAEQPAPGDKQEVSNEPQNEDEAAEQSDSTDTPYLGKMPRYLSDASTVLDLGTPHHFKRGVISPEFDDRDDPCHQDWKSDHTSDDTYDPEVGTPKQFWQEGSDIEIDES